MIKLMKYLKKSAGYIVLIIGLPVSYTHLDVYKRQDQTNSRDSDSVDK